MMKKMDLNAPQNDNRNNTNRMSHQDMNIIVCIRIQNQIQ